MHKLLIHITILFALIMLLCTPSAYGEGTAPSVTVVIDSRAVDLGLDVYWADRNVGASSPTDAGYYFAWGEVVERKNGYSWLDYLFHLGNNSVAKQVTKYCYGKTGLYGSYDGKTTLDLEDDAANSNPDWGGFWRMPTRQEIINIDDPSISGIEHKYSSNFPCVKFYKQNDESVYILIPNSGYKDDNGNVVDKFGGSKAWKTRYGCCYIWSSSLYTTETPKAYYYDIKNSEKYNFSDSHSNVSFCYRNWGYPVRPVIDKIKNVTLVVYKNGSQISSQTIAACPKGTPIKTLNDGCYTHEVYLNNGTTPISEEIITDSNATYKVYFTQKEFAVTASSNNTVGTAAITTNKTSNDIYGCGTKLTLTADPKDSCYYFEKWIETKNGTEKEISPSNNPGTCSTKGGVNNLEVEVDAAATYTAYFVQYQYTVTATTNNNLGSVTPAFASVDCGNSAVVTAKPDNNCVEFLGWDADNDGDIDYAPIHDNPGVSKGEQDTNGDYVLTIYNVTGKIGVKAFFQTKTYAVTASSNNTVGTAAITTNKTSNDIYGCGTKLTLTADPKDSCYYFEKWIETKNGTEKEISPSNNPGTCSTKGGVNNLEVEVDAAATYTAYFVQYQYTVTAAPNDGSLGYIVDTISGNNLNPPQTFDVNCGNWITFKARPTDNCISLFRWADDRTTPTVVYTPGHNDEDYSCTTDSNGVNTLIIYNVNKTIPHLYAVFVGNADSTKVESDGGGSASIKVEDGSNICDKIVTLTATAKECYKFSHWTKDTDDNWSGTSSQFTLSPVTEIATYTAHFIQVEEITVTIISEDKNKGTVAFDDGNNEENNQQE